VKVPDESVALALPIVVPDEAPLVYAQDDPHEIKADLIDADELAPISIPPLVAPTATPTPASSMTRQIALMYLII
jgi:hypothetical protein